MLACLLFVFAVFFCFCFCFPFIFTGLLPAAGANTRTGFQIIYFWRIIAIIVGRGVRCCCVLNKRSIHTRATDRKKVEGLCRRSI